MANRKKKVKTAEDYNRAWIVENAIPIIDAYPDGLTLRGLHYQLVNIGMTNDTQHYKKVVSAMVDARWKGIIDFDSFVDHDRETIGATDYEETNIQDSISIAKNEIRAWATSYNKNRWENQPIYPEVFIEKKALQGIFEKPCRRWDVALNPCKGYPSLTFLNDAKTRFEDAESAGKEPVILYFGDYDCSGEDIPRSIGDNLEKMGVLVEVKRIALMEDQVIEWNLPPAPTKIKDSRSRNWSGIGQVELDAVEPTKIRRLCSEAIEEVFDEGLHEELLEQEESENQEFKDTLKKEFKTLLD